MLTDREVNEFEKTEQRLQAWGYVCRQNTKALGMPTISGMAQIIAHIKVMARKYKGVRRLTAQGKEKRSFIRPALELSGDAMTVDMVISKLPKWAKKCIFRSYMYGQPDRKAAEDLRMPIGEYAQRRRAAVEQVAISLRQRYITDSLP